MINDNYIEIIGMIETLPKIININKKMCCEFLLATRAYVTPYGEDCYEWFSIPVLLSRKNAKRIVTRGPKVVGKRIKIIGELSFTTDMQRKYKGFYVYAKKVTM